MLQRVTNSMMHGMLLSDMQNNLARMLEIQKQLATQKKFSRPSDNPIDVTRSLAMDTTITENVQYQRNLDDALTWLKNTETAFDQITSVYQQVRQLAVYAGDGGLVDVDMGAIAEQLYQLQEEMRNAANYEVEGRFLLSGLSTGVRPFVRDERGRVIYQGSNMPVYFEMERQQLGRVSFTGRDLFQMDDKRYVITGFDVPLDFSWKGRDEIIQLQVGDQVVKARLPEKWKDEKLDNVADSTDYDRFREAQELEGYSLDDIAKALNDSIEMGDLKRLVSVSVEKDVSKGVQRLVVRSHNGLPVRLTTWPETDIPNLSQGIKGSGVPLGFTADAVSAMSVDFGGGVAYPVDVVGKTVAQIADELMKVPGIWAARKTDGVSEWLDVVSRDPSKSFSLKLDGNVQNLFGGVDAVTSSEVRKNSDHSHVDLARLLGMETSLKSMEVGVSWSQDTTSSPLHWKFVSGSNKGELFINGDPNLTMEELAQRITAVAGDWLEAVVETDEPDGTYPSPDPLDNSGSNAEGATKRLILRTRDGSPLVLYDGEKAGANYAVQLGVDTSIRGSGPVVYPSDGVGSFDENMPAMMEVTVGDNTYTVKLCRLQHDTGEKIAEAIVSQVNQQAGEVLLGVDKLSSSSDDFAILSLSGQPVRISDRGYGDPAYRSYTGGLAIQLGVATGISGGAVAGNLTAGSDGTLRISSLGRSVDVPVLAADNVKSLLDRVVELAGDWLNVAYYDPAVANPPGAGPVRFSISSKDGSPVSIFDVSGSAASTFNMGTALEGSALAAWTPVAGDVLTLHVNGMSHSIDLYDESAGQPIVSSLDELAELINARFQGQDIRAHAVDQGGGSKKLVLTSPRGYVVTVDESVMNAATRLGLTSGPTWTASSPNRGGSGPFNQVQQVRTLGNQSKQDFFGVMDDLINAVKNQDRRGISDYLLGKVTKWGDNLLRCRTECGALVNRYENTQGRLKQNNVNLTDLQSKISDVDLAEAATQFQMSQAVYQASLAVIARIVQPTLVDFLR
ncbi:flagellar hook-associated protein 3 [Thermanaerovibrio velox DSM 12556]|uniref:Flagellar hook-associated protein 3 n=1 Tax=Thermanaerovibrio velox DSM 12556 TaxID=926567 RepID=H0USG6_9BACT|nr:flagellar hook-associated protein FlgL [Thermanaerovibrio velox]EHM10255.1 flagellar hook-associated protein 3 [Thermanaerovibrio velox DSM 12556]